MPETIVETIITPKQARYVAALLLRATLHSEGKPITIRIGELDIQISTNGKQIM